MRSRVNLFALAALLIGCAHAGPRKGWQRYRVGSVEFYSGGSTRETEALVEEFEKFRVVTGKLTSAQSVEPRAPARVFLFPDQRSYSSYTKMENSGGMFALQAGEFTIAMNGNAGSSGREMLFHEYTHLILANSASMTYPTWYNEGFAELMATMTFVGKDVHLGRVSQSNVGPVANFPRWVPLSELLRGEVFRDRSDPDRLRRNYAQSWLLVHYIEFGSPSLKANLDRYLTAVHDGQDPVAAVPATFGLETPALEKELRDYLKEQRLAMRVLPAAQFDFQDATFAPEALSQAETTGALARMCWMVGNTPKAQELKAVAMAAGQPDPLPEQRLDTAP